MKVIFVLFLASLRSVPCVSQDGQDSGSHRRQAFRICIKDIYFFNYLVSCLLIQQEKSSVLVDFVDFENGKGLDHLSTYG